MSQYEIFMKYKNFFSSIFQKFFNFRNIPVKRFIFQLNTFVRQAGSPCGNKSHRYIAFAQSIMGFISSIFLGIFKNFFLVSPKPSVIMDAKQGPNILTVFDFDHTLVDGNTDTWITKLHEPAMAAIRSNRKKGLCWTNIMDLVFQQLHENNFSRQDVENCLKTLKFTEGMKETCEYIYNSNIPAIIISDSNAYFIDHLLKRDNLGHVFSQVITNPAEWNDDGCLQVRRFHSHSCSICPKNLCKKTVLTKYISEQMKENNSFDHIIYVGDGKGDFCPALSLQSKDYVLAREEYQLLDLLKEQSATSGVQPQIIPWTSGFHILDLVKKLYEKTSESN